MIKQHPLKGLAKFKLGTFASNADGGLALTTVAERWRARWDDCLNAAQIADRAGLDFLLPIARWRGFGGETHAREWSFEVFSWAAALAAVTERIGLFTTVHVPLMHPLYAAKALATLDHISRGRAGLNIVCGWNPDEFNMFGIPLDSDGYARAAEWIDVIERVYSADAPFDYEGRFYRLKSVVSRPASVQAPRPLVMNAAFSPPGRAFAARWCDYLFTTFADLDGARKHVADLAERVQATGRTVGLYTVGHVVCRQTQSEADDYYQRYAVQQVDEGAVDEHMSKKKEFTSSEEAGYQRYRQRFAGGAGTYPLVGTPQRIADQLIAIAAAGYGGIALSFVNFTCELPFFCDGVLPVLAQAGLRHDTTA